MGVSAAFGPLCRTVARLVEQPESASIKPPMTIARAIKAIVVARNRTWSDRNLPIIIVSFTLTKAKFL
jgi:hypothetical protein